MTDTDAAAGRIDERTDREARSAAESEALGGPVAKDEDEPVEMPPRQRRRAAPVRHGSRSGSPPSGLVPRLIDGDEGAHATDTTDIKQPAAT